ncbi:Uncharacterised protein [Dorea longicatena]|nr:Uncharacterised protein [Dorea longicatena]
MGYDIEKEKREAIEAGRRALNSLSTAKENLNSAKNWGLVDMFGGGFFSTMLKHSKMDHAKQNMEQAKYDLRNFSRELNDVNIACDLHIDTGDFLSFADYFFDGFVVDWMVQDRINTAKRQVEEAIRRTESIVSCPSCTMDYFNFSFSAFRSSKLRPCSLAVLSIQRFKESIAKEISSSFLLIKAKSLISSSLILPSRAI